MIERDRGGFCFELNGLFYSILKYLGFDVLMSEASVYIYHENKFAEMRNHMVLIVKLDREYLVDVGFVRASRYPVPIIGRSSCLNGEFRVVDFENMKELQYFDEDWHTQYHFRREHIELNEFQENCEWVQTSPDSMFTQKRMITIATNTGKMTLKDDFIKIRDKESVEKIEFTDQFDKYYKIYFGKFELKNQNK